MKVICILQNAWGGRKVPPVFKPNPFNKSAKVIRKIVGGNTFHFCNTSPHSAETASGRFELDHYHFQKLLPRIQSYDLILVCGKQAEKAFELYRGEIEGMGRPIIVMKHPAARTLTNACLEKIKLYISNVNTKKSSVKIINL